MSESVSLYDGEVTLDFDPVRHCYTWREVGLPVAGVTSILKLLDKPALVQWAANSSVEYIFNGYRKAMESADGMLEPTAFAALCQEAKTAHRRISKEATNVGSIVHKCAEAVLVNGRTAIPSDPQAAKGVAAFLDWYHSHKIEPLPGYSMAECSERFVLSRKWYYAGCCDFPGIIDNEICVLDFKTSSGLYLEMLLQLAAYAVALEEEINARIDAGWIIRLDKKTGKCQPYKIPLTNQIKDAWLRVREAHELVHKIEDQLDGLRQQRAA